jgi:hypothetical protein
MAVRQNREKLFETKVIVSAVRTPCSVEQSEVPLYPNAANTISKSNSNRPLFRISDYSLLMSAVASKALVRDRDF